MEVFWFLTTHGDGRYLGTRDGARSVSLGYLTQIACAADDLGYHGVLLPTGRSCEDAWVIASAMVPVTRSLKYLVAIRPGIITPTPSARMAATLDRLSGGRLLIKVVAGGDPDEALGDGVFSSHDARYLATDEFLTVWRGVLRGENIDFAGSHVQVKGAKVLYPPVQTPYPPLYFGGSCAAGHEIAVKHIDVYLTWGEPPNAVREKIENVRTLAAKHGRALRYGIRLHVIVRKTSAAASSAEAVQTAGNRCARRTNAAST